MTMDVDTGQTLHAHPLPDPYHRKIELQSPQDLHYLQSNLLALAREKLDRDLPPAVAQPQQTRKPTVISLTGVKSTLDRGPLGENNGENVQQAEEDYPLRAAVRAYVDAYISRTYASASHSITVNGLDATSLPVSTLSTSHSTPQLQTDATEPHEDKEGVDFQYDAYDTRLQKQVADMYRELETLTVQVGQLRREAPKQAAAAWAKLITETMESDDLEAERNISAVEEAALKDRDEALRLETLPDGWYKDRRVLYDKGRDELAALAGLADGPGVGAETIVQMPSLTETMGRVQRARTVAMEFD